MVKGVYTIWYVAWEDPLRLYAKTIEATSPKQALWLLRNYYGVKPLRVDRIDYEGPLVDRRQLRLSFNTSLPLPIRD